jgi:ribonuclease VapC
MAFFENEPGAYQVAGILRELMKQKARGYMSVINWGEVYYNTMRIQGAEEAEKVRRQFQKYPIFLIDADQEQTYKAAKLKGRYRIAYADCFAAALASSLKAPVVTGDTEFKKISDEVSILWIGSKTEDQPQGGRDDQGR